MYDVLKYDPIYLLKTKLQVKAFALPRKENKEEKRVT